jgi:heterotetrameric sarcosine oxidase gamma subunit
VISPALSRVVRRSALESVHAALGAQWLAEDIHWPAGYGPAGAAAEPEAAVAGRGAGLAEIGPFDELLIRGPGALTAIAALAAEPAGATAGRVVGVNLRGEPWSAWILEQDEVLLLSPTGGSLLTTRGQELTSERVSAIEMSGARTALRLAGPSAPSILAELCPVDTTPATMKSSDLVQAPLAGVRALIARQDTPSEPGYTILIARDEAAYAWDAIRAVGAVHGLTVVGPSAVGWGSGT